MNNTLQCEASNHTFIYNQYFTKVEKVPENRGAGVRPLPYFRASTSYFVIY
jgi:hypothetical protein